MKINPIYTINPIDPIYMNDGAKRNKKAKHANLIITNQIYRANYNTIIINYI